MESPSLAPSAIPAETLTRVVRSALQDEAAVPRADWTITPLPVMWQSSLRAGIYRLSGTADTAGTRETKGTAQTPGDEGGGRERVREKLWSVILRISQPPPEGSSGAHEHEFRYWRREVLLVQSGLLDGLDVCLLPPRTYLIEEDRAPSELWLWQEDLVPHLAGADAREVLHPIWPEERLFLAARHLGQLGGVFLRRGGQRPLPAEPWLCTTFLPQWVERVARWDRSVAPLLEDAAVWEHPLVRLAFPDAGEHRERMWRLHADVPALLEAYAALPQTLCHQDAWPANFFWQEAPGGVPVTRAIDWECAGVGALGADLGQLILGGLSGLYTRTEDATGFYRACTDAYIEGLLEKADASSHGGAEGLARAARAGAALFGVLRWGWLYTVGHVRDLLDQERMPRLEHQFRLPAERITQLRGAAARLALDMADEARVVLLGR